MGLIDALDRLDDRVLARYPWLWREPKRPFRAKVLLVVALGVTQSLTRLTHGGTWADVGGYFVKYTVGMVFLSPLFTALHRYQVKRRARGTENRQAERLAGVARGGVRHDRRMSEMEGESGRLAALRALGVLDTPPEERFDRIARAAAEIFGTPTALITLVDEHRQWFKARVGFSETETPRSESFCTHAIQGDEVLVVSDARSDQRFTGNPRVRAAPHIVFYAGAPVTAPGGERVGTVCIVGNEPRELTDPERRTLRALASWASSELASSELGGVAEALDRVGGRLAALLDAVPDAIFLLDRDGCLRAPNPAAGRLLGVAPQELEGTHYSRWLASDVSEALSRFRVAGDRRSNPREQLLLRCADGTVIPAEVTVTADEVGEGQRLVVAHSIKGQVDAQVAVERLRRQSEMILESAHHPLLGLDTDGVVRFANPAAHEVFATQDLVGMSLHERFHSRRADGSPYPWEECPSFVTLHRGEAVRLDEEVYWRADGTPFTAAYAGAPMIEDGAVTGMVLTIDDITVRKETERLKDELVGVVSHELRTPLTAIRGSLGILGGALGDELSERAAQMVDIALRGTDRMTRLVDDLLDLDRLGSGGMALQRVPCPVEDLVAEALESVRPQAQERGVVLRHQGEPGTVLWADRDRVVQCLVNLLGNAVKFSPDGGELSVSWSRSGDQGLVRVRDQGRGIPTGELDAVFERFRQIDPSDTRTLGGTGLGLAIVRGLAELHGGRVWAESPPGEGASFVLALPLAGSAYADGLAEPAHELGD